MGNSEHGHELPEYDLMFLERAGVQRIVYWVIATLEEDDSRAGHGYCILQTREGHWGEMAIEWDKGSYPQWPLSLNDINESGHFDGRDMLANEDTVDLIGVAKKNRWF